MILHKFWSVFVAQINKVANLFWEADPIAQMRYEYDRAVVEVHARAPGDWLAAWQSLCHRFGSVRWLRNHRSHGS